MNVKAVDVARELGISKATVSLALNNKPGVSEKTRQLVLACMQRLEESGPSDRETLPEKQRIIKVIVMQRGLSVATGAEINLWTDVRDVFDKIAKSWGCVSQVQYFDLLRDQKTELLPSCNDSEVAGVVIFASEMRPSDHEILNGIRKPLVVYDCDLDTDRYPCVVINNAGGAEMAAEYLIRHGKEDICYLARSLDLYNYNMRRVGFEAAMRKHGLNPEGRIRRMGTKIDEITDNLTHELSHMELPEAFITESYHLSLGLTRACRKNGIEIPKDVSMIAIDELPDFMVDGYQLTTIRVPHTERAVLTMELLRHEISRSSSTKSRIFTNCQMIERSSVSRKESAG